MKERPGVPVKLAPSEVFAINPTLKDWFSTHTSALLDGNKRLLSAEEKIGLLGGSEQIEKNYREARKSWSGNEYLILSACYRDPMHLWYIHLFGTLSVSKNLGLATILATIDDLRKDSLVVKKENLSLVMLGKNNTFSVHNRNGFLTTDEGFRKRAEMLGRNEGINPARKLAPQAQ